jgi:bifunctional DNase/RNase
VPHAAHARRVVLQNEAERLELIRRKSILIVLNYFESRLALRVFDVSIGAIEEQLFYNQLVFNEDGLSLVDRFSRVVLPRLL